MTVHSPLLGSRTIRQRLASAATIASGRAVKAKSPPAAQIFFAIAEIGTDWSRAGPECEPRLQDILGAVARMYLAADALERCRSGL